MFRFMTRGKSRRLAAFHADVLVLAADHTIDHWADVLCVRYTYPAGDGGASTSRTGKLPLGPGGTATAILVFVERRTGLTYIIAASDIADVMPASGVQWRRDGPSDAEIDRLIQFAVFGKVYYAKPPLTSSSASSSMVV